MDKKQGTQLLSVIEDSFDQRIEKFSFNAEMQLKIQKCRELKRQVLDLDSEIDFHQTQKMYEQGFLDGIAFAQQVASNEELSKMFVSIAESILVLQRGKAGLKCPA